MSIRRFFSAEKIHDEQICIRGEEVHHILDVNRLRIGAEIELTDGQGWVHLGCIDSFKRDRVSVRIVRSQFSPKPPMRIHMAVSLLKGKAMSFVVERLTEVGVDRITPIIFSRTDVSRTEAGRANKWLRIAEQAIKVNDNPWLPIVDEPVALDTLLSEKEEYKTKVLLDLGDSYAYQDLGDTSAPALALIGPPGGFTNEERGQIKAAGFQKIRMCKWTLRSETAALFAAAWLSTSLPQESGS